MKGKLITLSFNKELNDIEAFNAIGEIRKEVFTSNRKSEFVYAFKLQRGKNTLHAHIFTSSDVEEKDLIKHWKQGLINITDIKSLDECSQCLRYMEL